MVDNAYFYQMFTEKGALYSDNAGSTWLFDSKKVQGDLLDRTAFEMMWGLIRHGCSLSRITKVVGVGIHSATLAQSIAQHISEDIDMTVYGVYAEESKDAQGRTTMVLKSSDVQAGDCVVLCTHVLTTGLRTVLTAQAVEEKGAFFLPFVTTIVNYSKSLKIYGIDIVSIFRFNSTNE